MIKTETKKQNHLGELNLKEIILNSGTSEMRLDNRFYLSNNNLHFIWDVIDFSVSLIFNR